MFIAENGHSQMYKLPNIKYSFIQGILKWETAPFM